MHPLYRNIRCRTHLGGYLSLGLLTLADTCETETWGDMVQGGRVALVSLCPNSGNDKEAIETHGRKWYAPNSTTHGPKPAVQILRSREGHPLDGREGETAENQNRTDKT